MGRGDRQTIQALSPRRNTSQKNGKGFTIASAKQQIGRYPDKAELKELWPLLTREAWIESRKQAMRQLKALNPADVIDWADSNPGVISSDDYLLLKDWSRGQEKKGLNQEQRDLLKKAAVIADERGLSFKEIVFRARNSHTVASLIQKAPSKQNIYEPIASAFIELRSDLLARQLNSKPTVLQIRFDEQGNVSIDDKKKDDKCKSADLAIINDQGSSVSVELLAHKFARKAGGHQDNQKNDANAFLTSALKAKASGERLPDLRKLVEGIVGRPISEDQFSWRPGLLLDGDYFEDKIDEIKSGYPSNVFIGSTDQLIA